MARALVALALGDPRSAWALNGLSFFVASLLLNAVLSWWQSHLPARSRLALLPPKTLAVVSIVGTWLPTVVWAAVTWLLQNQ